MTSFVRVCMSIGTECPTCCHSMLLQVAKTVCQVVLMYSARTCVPGPIGELLQVCIRKQREEAEATRVLLCSASQNVVPYSLASLQCADSQAHKWLEAQKGETDREPDRNVTMTAATGHSLPTHISAT